MKERMASHGLGEPVFDMRDGWLGSALVGPGKSLDRVKSSQVAWPIPAGTRKELSNRQEKMGEQVSERYIAVGLKKHRDG